MTKNLTNWVKNLTHTPQSEPIPGTTQVPNSAGGYSWKVDDWTRLDRFLVLGAKAARTTSRSASLPPRTPRR